MLKGARLAPLRSLYIKMNAFPFFVTFINTLFVGPRFSHSLIPRLDGFSGSRIELTFRNIKFWYGVSELEEYPPKYSTISLNFWTLGVKWKTPPEKNKKTKKQKTKQNMKDHITKIAELFRVTKPTKMATIF